MDPPERRRNRKSQLSGKSKRYKRLRFPVACEAARCYSESMKTINAEQAAKQLEISLDALYRRIRAGEILGLVGVDKSGAYAFHPKKLAISPSARGRGRPRENPEGDNSRQTQVRHSHEEEIAWDAAAEADGERRGLPVNKRGRALWLRRVANVAAFDAGFPTQQALTESLTE